MKSKRENIVPTANPDVSIPKPELSLKATVTLQKQFRRLYDPRVLFNNYHLRHIANPAKHRPLTLVEVQSDEMRAEIDKTLETWQKQATKALAFLPSEK